MNAGSSELAAAVAALVLLRLKPGPGPGTGLNRFQNSRHLADRAIRRFSKVRSLFPLALHRLATPSAAGPREGSRPSM